jgi:hypothetical protein
MLRKVDPVRSRVAGALPVLAQTSNSRASSDGGPSMPASNACSMSSATGFGKPAVAFQTCPALARHMTSARGGGSTPWVGKVVPRPRSLASVSSRDITGFNNPSNRVAGLCPRIRGISLSAGPHGKTAPRQGPGRMAGWVFVGDDTPHDAVGTR